MGKKKKKGKKIRLLKVAKELNVGTSTLAETLQEKGYDVKNKPTAKLTEEMYKMLQHEFQSEKMTKEEAEKIEFGKKERETIGLEEDSYNKKRKKEDSDEILIQNVSSSSDISKKEEEEKKEKEKKKKKKEKDEEVKGPKVVGKVDLEEKKKKKKKKEKKKGKKKGKKKSQKIGKKKDQKKGEKVESDVDDLSGPKVVGKVDLKDEKKEKEKKKKDDDKKLVASSSDKFVPKKKKKRKRKRIKKKKRKKKKKKGKKKKKKKKEPKISEKEVEDKVKKTLSKLDKKKRRTRQKRKRAKKKKEAEEAAKKAEEEANTIEVTEFISANELANLMDVEVNELITTCMNLGVVVSINQRLDAELIELVADEYDYDVKFVDIKEKEEGLAEEEEEQDDPEDLEPRPPIITVMGHVDHGKTKLLDYIREANIAGGEKGGITQHIGAYAVETKEGKQIAFLDTPGHEAFTAMRARGAKLTDIAVIVIAADEGIQPQTQEAINHAQAANVNMIFAINKIDKPEAKPEKIKEQLANENILVEDWGGKYQSEEVSAKRGDNVDELLEKILIEAELLELKANPDRKAKGTVIEATLDKGKGYITNILVQNGTIHKGDFILAGAYAGRIRAMFDQFGNRIEKAGPSTPVQVLGLKGAAQAGDPMKVYEDEQKAKEIGKKKQQILREQGLRAQKHITLDEIGRRLALGTFQELNIIVKADVAGSVEALTDELQSLTTEEIQINIVHKGVGQITESDVLLAAASDALIIGFQVRPSQGARKTSKQENIEIRLYSVIYNAIEEVKSAMEGLLAPKEEEKYLGVAEVKELFKISKVGTVAGCQVQDGKIKRNGQIRVIRDGIVKYSGNIESLKRFQEDAKEVTSGMECGIKVEDFDDIKEGDELECFKKVKVKRTLQESK